jgi:hypothetical protein
VYVCIIFVYRVKESEMALLRKLFFRKPPDGLFEICERVYGAFFFFFFFLNNLLILFGGDI